MSIGDGCLKINKKNGKNSSYVFHINHSTKQREYIEWKHKKFEEILEKKIKLTERPSPYKGKMYRIVTFAVVHKYFKTLRRFLYKGGKKEISPKVIRRLNTLGLAILYLDDGSLNIQKSKDKKRINGIHVRLHLSIPKHQVNPILRVFKEKFDIEFKAYRENSHQELYLLYATKTSESLKFLDLVRDHVKNDIGCMQYKLGEIYLEQRRKSLDKGL